MPRKINRNAPTLKPLGPVRKMKNPYKKPMVEKKMPQGRKIRRGLYLKVTRISARITLNPSRNIFTELVPILLLTVIGKYLT